MQQIKGLWRDTWWLWSLFAVADIAFCVLASPIFIAILLGLPVCFLYFAFIRYDENGNEKEGV